MEKIDELKAKSMASNSTNTNPSNDIEASKNKEEGELSDSYDDENLGCSTAQSSGTVAPPSGPNSAPSTIKSVPPNLAGNTISGNNLASTVDIRQPIPPKSQKNIEKNRLPFKSTNPSWYAPSGGSNNLVIRFSDDDSGSDSEECSQQKTVENKSNSTRDGAQRHLTSSVPRLNKLGQTSRNITRVIPKKPLSRTSISSMTKINGGANSRVAGPSLVDQGSRVRYVNPSNKNSASQDLVSDQGVGSSNSKLQDLRQQIALRVSELKHKTAQQHKEIVSASTMNLDNGAGRKWMPTSADAGSIDPKEPDKKRLKVSESYFTHVNPGAQQEVHRVKSNLGSKDHKLETKSLQSKDKLDHSKNIAPTSKAKSNIKWQKKDDKLVDVSSEDMSKVVKDGVDMHKNSHQSKRTSRQVDPSVLANQTASLTKITASALPNNLSNMENHPTKVGLHNPPRSSVSKATRELKLSKGNDYHEVTSGDKTLEPYFSKKCQASQNTASLWNCLDNVNISGHCNVDVNMHSLVEIEEKLDKELEEAQQHRHLCEIEERNALKTYRKAQRALIEANARCTDLYCQRELCSARFRSFIVDDSSLSWSSRQHEHTGIGLDNSNNVPENMDLVPLSTHRLQPDYDGFNQPGYDPNIQCINVASRNMFLQHDNGQNLGSEPCSEPDGSTSEPFPHNSNNAANGGRSLCSPIIPADEDEETSPMDHDSVQPSPEYQQKEQKCEVIQKNANNESSNQDSLLLEATLRSELFARLGMRTSSKNIDSCYQGEPSVERGAENDVESEKTQMSNGSVTLSEAEKKNQNTLSEAEKKNQFDSSGPQNPNEVISEALAQNGSQHHEKFNISKFLSAANLEDNGFSSGCHCSATSILFSPSSILRSAIGLLKIKSPVTRQRENHFYSEEGAYVNFDEIEWSGHIANSLEEAGRGLSGKEMGSYMCTIAVDPFWPLCMFELRGKCNNDECPFQHVKDFSKRNTYPNAHDDSDSADCQLGLTSCQQRSNGPTKPSKCHDVFISPIYIVSLDILKADSHPHESVATWGNAHCWWKCFSICLALSSFLQKYLPTDEPCLDGNDGRIEVHGNWNRQSSYFQSRNGTVSKLNQALGTDAQSLEMALLILHQEVNKLEGMKKALSLMSRALEADPASETLWIVYLLICYSHMTFFGKDDMFSYAGERVWTKGPLQAEIDPLDLEPEDVITSFDYLMEKEALIVGTSSGLLLLHTVDGKETEVVGRVDGGVKCISPSPDGDLLGVTTGFGQLLVMTHDWDLLYETALEDHPEGVDVREPDFSSSELSGSPISWRGDGKYFATLSEVSNSSSLNKRLKVWERDAGAVHASSEPKELMGSILEWMPSGAKIAAVCHRKAEVEGPSIVFYERNGLERSSFHIDEPIDATVELLKWNCSSDLLAAVVRSGNYDSVKIWFFSNNYWYLKHEIKYSRKDGVRFMWDPTKSQQLICWTLDGQITINKFIWVTAVMDDSTALVIDDSKILVTPLSLSLMPPPMYLFSLNFPSAVREIAFYSTNGKNRLAAFLSNGSLCVAELPTPDTWEELEGKEFSVEPCVSATPLGSFVHLIWLDSHMLLAVSHHGFNHSNCSFQTSSSKDRLLGFYLQEIELSCSEDNVPGLLTCSGWHAKVSYQNLLEGLVIGIAPNPAKKCSAFVQFDGGEVFEYASKLGINRRDLKHDEISFSSSCPWMNVVLVGATEPSKLLLFGLDDMGRLHVCRRILCSNCSSFSFYSIFSDNVITHLILATKQDLLFIVDISDILHGELELTYGNFIHVGSKRREEENINFINIWERGAKIVGVLHGQEAAVILQTNRGNLECIYPRKLVLASIVNALNQRHFRDALLMVRRHRIDFNVIVDYYGLQVFIQLASEFVRQVNNLSYITEFVCAIKSENLTQTLYKKFLSPPSCKEQKDLQTNDFKSSDASLDANNKVSSVLLAIRRALEEQVPASPARELCILTTLARTDPPSLEEALERIKVIREMELLGSDDPRRKNFPSAEEALKHLLWLSDSEAIFEAALGLYDLNLAAIVALNSQRDPKEFLPFLQELEHMPILVMRYNIDLRLHRFEKALKHIVSAGDAHFADCMNLMKKNPQLFPLGLQLITDPTKRGQVLEAWGDHLSDEKCFEDSAATYLCCSSLQKALKAYRECSNWSGVLTVAGLIKMEKDEAMQLAHELCEELQALGKPGEAAKIALEYCGDINAGIHLLISARDWEEALRVAFLHSREELVSEVKIASSECASSLIDEYKEGLEKVGKYLARYLAVRQRRLLLAAKLRSEERSINDLDDDTASEASSTFSGMSVYTTGTRKSSAASTGSTVASKARDTRRQRSRGKIRPGSPGEEMALVEHLKGMSLTAGAKRELKSLLVSLVMLGNEETARRLQHVGENFQLSHIAAVRLAEDTMSNDIINEHAHTLELYVKKVKTELLDSDAFSWRCRVFLSP